MYHLSKNSSPVMQVFTYLLIAVLILGMFPASASAASISWPSVSESSYIEATAEKSFPVYNSSKLTTRGTSSPKRSYNASVYAGDTIKIRAVNNTWLLLSYPTSNGERIGYVKRSSVFASAPNEYFVAKAKVATLYSPGGKTYGNTAVGDKIYVCGGKNSHKLIIYTAKSGKRGWKVGYVSSANFNKLKGISITNTTATLSSALYKIQTSSSYITCGFDGYVNTRGRHEGIDFKYKTGAAVYSLTDGILTNVVYGANGSSGLSTIAIYNANTDKTIVYLHTAPLSSLKVGQKINKGAKIATESWRGISSSKSAHTHVEVRNGRKTLAAKSVGDSTLDNPNPSNFWKTMGYSMK